jgi:hypothetical protein
MKIAKIRFYALSDYIFLDAPYYETDEREFLDCVDHLKYFSDGPDVEFVRQNLEEVRSVMS